MIPRQGYKSDIHCTVPLFLGPTPSSYASSVWTPAGISSASHVGCCEWHAPVRPGSRFSAHIGAAILQRQLSKLSRMRTPNACARLQTTSTAPPVIAGTMLRHLNLITDVRTTTTANSSRPVVYTKERLSRKPNTPDSVRPTFLCPRPFRLSDESDARAEL